MGVHLLRLKGRLDQVEPRPDWRHALEELQQLETFADGISAARRADVVVEQFLRALGYGAIAGNWRTIRDRVS